MGNVVKMIPVWGWLLIVFILFILTTWGLFLWFYKATQKFCDVSMLHKLTYVWKNSKSSLLNAYEKEEKVKVGRIKKFWGSIMWNVCANVYPKSYPEAMALVRAGRNTKTGDYIKGDKNWVWIRNYGWFIPGDDGIKQKGIGRWWQKYIHKIMEEIYNDAKEKGIYWDDEMIIILNPKYR